MYDLWVEKPGVHTPPVCTYSSNMFQFLWCVPTLLETTEAELRTHVSYPKNCWLWLGWNEKSRSTRFSPDWKKSLQIMTIETLQWVFPAVGESSMQLVSFLASCLSSPTVNWMVVTWSLINQLVKWGKVIVMHQIAWPFSMHKFKENIPPPFEVGWSYLYCTRNVFINSRFETSSACIG